MILELKAVNTKSPLVSVIIPTHRPNHLRNALMCAISQTYSNIEIIVSDNSGGVEIKKFCEQFPQIIYRRNTDGKAATNISDPLLIARGEFVKYLFDDDLIYPNSIDSMIGCLTRMPLEVANNIGLITSARHLIDDNSRTYGELKESGINSIGIFEGKSVIKRILVLQNNFIGEFSTILFRRNLINIEKDPKTIFKAYGEDFSLGLIDIPLYIKLLEKSNMVYIPYALSAFRQHKEGGSTPSANPNFHHAVSDWFRLIAGARLHGVINTQEAITGARGYLRLAENYQSLYSSQLAPWNLKAQDFIDDNLKKLDSNDAIL